MVKKSKNIERQTGPKKIHVTLPEELHKKVKVKCVYEDQSIQAYVARLIREDLRKYRVEVQEEE